MSIYDEAIEKVDWIFSNSNIPNYELRSICVALERAKKEHELLGLYRDLIRYEKSNWTDKHFMINTTKEQIKQKEEEMK